MLEQEDDHYDPVGCGAWVGGLMAVVAIALGVLVLLTVAWCWRQGGMP